MNKNGAENSVRLSGYVVDEPEYAHEIFGEDVFQLHLECFRRSGTGDMIPVTISAEMVASGIAAQGNYITVTGAFHSLNFREGERSKLLLSVHAEEIAVTLPPTRTEDTNIISLGGFICRKPVYRKTPMGREITDLLVAVNGDGRSDYIPCIAWFQNARAVSELRVGSRIEFDGRIQSREYIKKTATGEEKRRAIEVSINKIAV